MLGNALAHHAHRLRFVLAEIDPLARHGVFQRGMREGAAGGRRRRGRSGGAATARQRLRKSPPRVPRALAPPVPSASRISFLLMRPPAPLPSMDARSTLCSFASLRTRGELRIFCPLGRTAGAAGSRAALAAGGAAAGAGAGAAGAGGAAAALGAGGLFLRRGGSGRRGWSRRGGAGRIDHRDHGLNGHGLAFGHLDFLQHSGGRRRDLRVHLVGRNFEQRLIAFDAVARLLEPSGDGSFKNAFPHLGHDDVYGHGCPLS